MKTSAPPEIEQPTTWIARVNLGRQMRDSGEQMVADALQERLDKVGEARWLKECQSEWGWSDPQIFRTGERHSENQSTRGEKGTRPEPMNTIDNSQTPTVGLISTGDEKGAINPSPPVPRISSRRLRALQDVREADDLAVANARHRSDRMFIERVKLGWVPQTEADWMNVGVAALVIRQPSDRIRYIESTDPDAGPIEHEPSFRARIFSIECRLRGAHERIVKAQEALSQIQQDRERLEQDPRPTYAQALALYHVWRERLRDAGIDDMMDDDVRFAWERSPIETRGPEPFHPDEYTGRVRPEITLDQVAEKVSAITRAREALLDEIADAPWVACRLGLGPDPSIWSHETPSVKTRHGHYAGGESLTLVSVRKRRESARNSNGRIPILPEWAEDQTAMLEWVLTNLGERPSRAHTLHRKVNALGYTPGNIAWATKRTQRIEQDRTGGLTDD